MENPDRIQWVWSQIRPIRKFMICELWASLGSEGGGVFFDMLRGPINLLKLLVIQNTDGTVQTHAHKN